MEVSILDINDNPPRFQRDLYEIEVAEEDAQGEKYYDPYPFFFIITNSMSIGKTLLWSFLLRVLLFSNRLPYPDSHGLWQRWERDSELNIPLWNQICVSKSSRHWIFHRRIWKNLIQRMFGSRGKRVYYMICCAYVRRLYTAYLLSALP